MHHQGQFRVYGLQDPETSEIRYVGQTTNRLGQRLAEHCGPDLRKKTLKTAWVRALLERGKEPEILLLEEVQGTRQDAYQAETAWIRRLRGQGHRLLNTPIPQNQAP